MFQVGCQCVLGVCVCSRWKVYVAGGVSVCSGSTCMFPGKVYVPGGMFVCSWWYVHVPSEEGLFQAERRCVRAQGGFCLSKSWKPLIGSFKFSGHDPRALGDTVPHS
jgi:hypothetical protein